MQSGVARLGRRKPFAPHIQKFRIVGAGSPSLVAGVASFVSSGATTLIVTATDATSGTAPYTYQWQRSVDGGAYSNISNGGGVSGATTLTITDGSTASPHSYGYKLVYTDAQPSTATSNAVGNLYNYSGGAIGGGGTIHIIGG